MYLLRGSVGYSSNSLFKCAIQPTTSRQRAVSFSYNPQNVTARSPTMNRQYGKVEALGRSRPLQPRKMRIPPKLPPQNGPQQTSHHCHYDVNREPWGYVLRNIKHRNHRSHWNMGAPYVFSSILAVKPTRPDGPNAIAKYDASEEVKHEPPYFKPVQTLPGTATGHYCRACFF